jgi:hypothetical protein
MNSLDAYLRSTLKILSSRHKPPTGGRERLLESAARPISVTKSKMVWLSFPEPRLKAYYRNDWSAGMFEWTNGTFLRTEALNPRPFRLSTESLH